MIFDIKLPIPGISEILDLFGISLTLGDVLAFIAAMIDLGISAISNLIHMVSFTAIPSEKPDPNDLADFDGDHTLRVIACVMLSIFQTATDIETSGPSSMDNPGFDIFRIQTCVVSLITQFLFFPNDVASTVFWGGIAWTLFSTILGLFTVKEALKALWSKMAKCSASVSPAVGGGGGGGGADTTRIILGVVKILGHSLLITNTWVRTPFLRNDTKIFYTLHHAMMVASGGFRIATGVAKPNGYVIAAMSIAEFSIGIAASGMAYYAT